eukprot:s5710_g5.t1
MFLERLLPKGKRLKFGFASSVTAAISPRDECFKCNASHRKSDDFAQLKGFNHMLPTIRLLAAAAVSMDKTSITPGSISLMKRNTGVARPVQDAKQLKERALRC